MKQSIFTVLSNTALTDSVYKMVLSGDTSAITNCGQFVNIQLDGLFLRRPISVCDYDAETLTIVYKVVGKGTEAMFKMGDGTKLDIHKLAAVCDVGGVALQNHFINAVRQRGVAADAENALFHVFLLNNNR